MPFGNMGGMTFVLILVIVLLLFGAPKLPKLAKSIGESMRIFKGEMKTMKDESSSTSGQQQSNSATSEAPSGQSASEAPSAQTPAAQTPPAETPPSTSSSDGNDAPAR